MTMEALAQNLNQVATDVQQLKLEVQGEILTATASINQLQGQANQHQQEMQAAMTESERLKTAGSALVSCV